METGLFATAACDIADGRNGRMALAPLANTQIVAGRKFRESFGLMANALFNGREGDAIGALGDVATYGAALNTMALKAIDSDNRYRRVSLELTAAKRERDAKAGALRDCERAESTSAMLAESLKSELEDVRSDLAVAETTLGQERARIADCMAANSALCESSARLEQRNATQAETIRGLTADVERLKLALEDNGRAVLDLSGSALAEQKRADNNLASANALERRAEAAERQLAEYRAILATLPYGMARAYPGALVLMRAYLADVESSDRPAVRYIVDGHVAADTESDLAGDGAYPPFRIFDPIAQDYIGSTYTTREAAQRAADTLNG